jgi:YVTN family beta-propeller protein
MRSCRVKKCLAAAFSFLLMAACTVGGGAPITYDEVRIPTLPGAASFDAMDINQQSHRLYVADRTDSGVDVIDLTTSPATYTHTIALGSSPNGLVYAADLHRIFVGLADGSLGIIDEASEKVINQVPAGGKTVDLIDYSPSTHEVFAGVSDNSVARIDATTGTVKNVIKLDASGIEQPRYNPVDQLLYVTSPGSDSMFIVDPTTGSVKNELPLGNCSPNGMAINTKTDQALIACRLWVQRINLRNTSDQQPISEVEGGDIVTYFAGADKFLVGTPDSIPSGVAVLSGNPIRFIATAQTKARGNSAALDETKQIVYTPDTRPGTVGLVAFDMPTEEPGLPIDWSTLLEAGALLAVAAIVVAVVGRGGDPKNRPEPIPVRRRPRFSR